jgi:hypothetical protein
MAMSRDLVVQSPVRRRELVIARGVRDNMINGHVVYFVEEDWKIR